MTKEDYFCDNPLREWVVSYGGNTFVASYVSARNARRELFPELNLEANGKEFIVQFDNFTDIAAARDTGKELHMHVMNLSKTKRVLGEIKHRLK